MSGTVHHPSTKELLNKQVDQIAELKYKIAELQDSHVSQDEFKKLQERLKKSKKYE